MSGVSAFLWQAGLLLLVAYFLGAWIGCWLRRTFSPPPKVAMESGSASGRTAAAASIAAAAAATAATANRFSRALDGGEPAAAPTVNGALGDAAVRPAKVKPIVLYPVPEKPAAKPAEAQSAQPAATKPAAPQPAQPAATRPAAPQPAQPAATRPAAPQPAQPAATRPAAPQPPPPPAPGAKPAEPKREAAFTPPMTAAAAALAARTLVEQQRSKPEQPATAGTERAAPPPGKPPAANSVAAKMETLAPPPASKAAPAEQPLLPAASGSDGGAGVAARIDQKPAASASTAVAPTGDNLRLIDGITPQDAAALRKAGVARFADIANWTADDVRRFSGIVGGDRRIARENWIEQAQLLNQNGGTAYTRRAQADIAPRPPAPAVPPRARRTAAEPPRPAPAPPSPVAQGASPGATAGAAAASAAAAAASAAALAPITGRPPAAPPAATKPATASASPAVADRAAFARNTGRYRDDLQRIDGINGEVEKKLNEQGITRISQIAGWSVREQDRVDRLFGGLNRVTRENWVGQARRISGYKDDDGRNDTAKKAAATIDTGATADTGAMAARAAAATAAVAATAAAGSAPSPDNVTPIGVAPAPGRNVRGLRSVRSEGLVGGQAGDDGEAGDDLKRIRGIGVLIEKRLRTMGYTSYAKIGSWTQSDVDRVNQQLDFRGRIERENWIEQARILAAGGQTDFSRRQERGDD